MDRLAEMRGRMGGTYAVDIGPSAPSREGETEMDEVRKSPVPPQPGNDYYLGEERDDNGGGHAAITFTGSGDGTTMMADDNDNGLDDFYTVVSRIQTNIRTIEHNTTAMRNTHAEILESPDDVYVKKLRHENEQRMAENQQLANETKDLIKSIGESADKLRQEDEAGNAGVIKIHTNQQMFLAKSFTACMMQYQKCNQEIDEKSRDQIERRIQVKYTNADGSTISEDKARQLASQVMESGCQDVIFQQSKDTLQQIIETRNDILRVERSIRELNQMFTDMAVLVNEQGEILDNVLVNVQRSVTYVEKGRAELKKGKKYAKKSRRKFCWLIMFTFIILALIVGPSVMSQQK